MPLDTGDLALHTPALVLIQGPVTDRPGAYYAVHDLLEARSIVIPGEQMLQVSPAGPDLLGRLDAFYAARNLHCDAQVC